jgi:hypothetical protein
MFVAYFIIAVVLALLLLASAASTLRRRASRKFGPDLLAGWLGFAAPRPTQRGDDAQAVATPDSGRADWSNVRRVSIMHFEMQYGVGNMALDHRFGMGVRQRVGNELIHHERGVLS